MEDVKIVCSSCEEEIQENESLRVNDAVYCQSCFDDKYVVCCKCLETVEISEAKYYDGEHYCEDCHFDNFAMCEICEDVFPDDEVSNINIRIGYNRSCERSVCQNCIDNYNQCEDCDVYADDCYYVRGIGNVCQRCYEDGNYGMCESCDDMYHTDHLEYVEDDGYYCEHCYDVSKKIIKSYSYKPNPTFFGSGKLFFGIELEVEDKTDSKGYREHNATAESIELPELYFKEDGSLSNGFEIVSHPMSPDYIEANKDKFKQMLDKLIEAKYNSYDANTCGMHIHLTKSAFGTWQLYRFMKFFVDNREFIVKISQRKHDKLERWANIEDEGEGDLIYKAKHKNGGSNRYVAINLQNSKTVELRIFRGTLNFNSFMKNIQFANALFNFTRDEKDMTVDNFKTYISKTNEYDLLKKFIKDKNI
jgi:Putative amidoligase enzyme